MKYIAVSGGMDSTALVLLLWEHGVEFELVFSDTGAELPKVSCLLSMTMFLQGNRTFLNGRTSSISGRRREN